MKNMRNKLLALIGIVLIWGNLTAQTLPANWHYTYTGTNHTILMQPGSIVIDGLPAPTTGCYVGVFFETTTGTLKCGGYSAWTGAINNITAWGVDMGNDGFSVGQEFQWKIFVMANYWEYNATASYMTNLSHSNLFAPNGISGVTSVSASNIIELVAQSWNSPASGCGLSSSETVSVSIISNSANLITDTIALSYSIDGGINWVTENYLGGISPGSTISYTFSQTADFSALSTQNNQPSDSTYSVLFKVMHPDDLDTTNNMLSTQVTNMIPPEVYFTGLDSAYCMYPSLPPIQLTGYPSGGIFSGTGIIGNDMFIIGSGGWPFAGPGQHEITYQYNDPVTGCQSNYSTTTNIYSLPVATISGYNSLHVCQYDSMTLTGSPQGGIFSGTYVYPTTGLFLPLTPGSFNVYYTYTDEHGCSDDSPVKTLTVHQLPTAHITNPSRAYCVNSMPEILTGSPVGGTFSISGGDGIIGNILYPAELSAGTYSITYTFTDNYNCTDVEIKAIKVFDVPIVSISGLESHYCQSGDTIVLTGLPAGGTWSGNNSDSIFIPEIIGQHTIGYQYGNMEFFNSDSVYCSDEASETTLVTSNPELSLSIVSDTISQQPILITTEITNGTAPFSYYWDNFATTSSISTDTSTNYSLSVSDAYSCTGSASATITFPTLVQAIIVNQGWNMISTYIDPSDADCELAFAPILSNLIVVKNETGQVYWPAFAYNQIGGITVGEAYKIKMNTADTIQIAGLLVLPEFAPIPIQAGWSMIGYLRTSPAAISLMMSDIATSIIVVKNNSGYTFWPMYGVDQIMTMYPGEGYKINMSNADTLYYAPNIYNY